MCSGPFTAPPSGWWTSTSRPYGLRSAIAPPLAPRSPTPSAAASLSHRIATGPNHNRKRKEGTAPFPLTSTFLCAPCLPHGIPIPHAGYLEGRSMFFPLQSEEQREVVNKAIDELQKKIGLPPPPPVSFIEISPGTQRDASPLPIHVLRCQAHRDNS